MTHRAFAANAIFVTNYGAVTAYSAAGGGDLAPIALNTDMVGPSGIARDASGRTYVTNRITNTVTVYPPEADGNVAPLAVIGGSSTRLSNPSAIALDAGGRIYVLDGGDSHITVYPPLGSNTGTLNEAPVAEIRGARTRLHSPVAIALDGRGQIYVANQGGGPAAKIHKNFRGVLAAFYAPASVTVYRAGSDGDVAPIAVIRGFSTGLFTPMGIALDTSGNIYVADNGADFHRRKLHFSFPQKISVYVAGSSGDAQPIATISGPNTGRSRRERRTLRHTRRHRHGIEYTRLAYPRSLGKALRGQRRQ